jgi:stringent starvation protein A
MSEAATRSASNGQLLLWDAGRCPFAARVRIVLAEKAIDYETREVDLDDRPEELYTLHPPDGRVPVLEVNATILVESQAIMEYLEERFPEPPLLPAQAEARARCRAAVVASERLNDAFYDLFWRRPGGSWDRLDGEFSRLDGVLARQPYMVGSSYSLADVAHVVLVLRARQRLKLDLTPYPAILSWLERLGARAAVESEIAVVEACCPPAETGAAARPVGTQT